MKLEGNFKYFLNGKQISEEQYKRLKPNLSVTFNGDQVICRLDVKNDVPKYYNYLDEVVEWYETNTKETGVNVDTTQEQREKLNEIRRTCTFNDGFHEPSIEDITTAQLVFNLAKERLNKDDMRINPDAIKLFKTVEVTPVDLFLKGESNGNESLKDVLDNVKTESKPKQEIKENFEKMLSDSRYRRGHYIDYSSQKNDTNIGHKESNGKLSYELDWNFIEQMASRMSKNKYKYEPYNWQKPIDIEGLKQALFRHVMDVMRGNYSDDGRALGHLESVALNAMIINYQIKKQKNK